MVFASHVFLGFLSIVLLAYALAGRYSAPGTAKYVLIVASLFFYGYWLPAYLILLLGSIGFNYLIANFMISFESGRARKTILGIGVTANLALIAYYKYAAFLVETYIYVSSATIDVPDIILPIGISFFTFQQISYLVSRFRREIDAPKFVDYVFFISFFPQLIAGPIVTAQQFLPQLAIRKSWKIDAEQLAIGFSLFAAGLFKKTVLIDPYVAHFDIIYERAANDMPIGFVDGWTAALGYSFQIYFDFSAYSDMALGLALMFGIRLPINFFSPYKATSIRDFWRRWHITLSKFLRDYLYIPLGGSRHGLSRTMGALLITMGIGGLWHGAGWTFVIWGLGHGVLLALMHCAQRMGMVPQPPKAPLLAVLYRSAAVATTFLLVTVLWVVFRAEDVSSAMNIWAAMFGAGHETSVTRFWRTVGPLFLVYFFIVWFTPNLVQIFRRYTIGLDSEQFQTAQKWYWPERIWVYQIGHWQWALISALIFVVAWFSMSNLSPFIYFQF